MSEYKCTEKHLRMHKIHIKPNKTTNNKIRNNSKVSKQARVRFETPNTAGCGAQPHSRITEAHHHEHVRFGKVDEPGTLMCEKALKILNNDMKNSSTIEHADILPFLFNSIKNNNLQINTKFVETDSEIKLMMELEVCCVHHYDRNNRERNHNREQFKDIISINEKFDEIRTLFSSMNYLRRKMEDLLINSKGESKENVEHKINTASVIYDRIYNDLVRELWSIESGMEKMAEIRGYTPPEETEIYLNSDKSEFCDSKLYGSEDHESKKLNSVIVLEEPYSKDPHPPVYNDKMRQKKSCQCSIQ